MHAPLHQLASQRDNLNGNRYDKGLFEIGTTEDKLVSKLVLENVAKCGQIRNYDYFAT
jgi:hypothetical protein